MPVANLNPVNGMKLAFTPRNMENGDMQAVQGTEVTTISFPIRWTTRRIPNADAAAKEIDYLSSTLAKSAEAIHGLYMRLCDVIRAGHLTEGQIRNILATHFPLSRVSEILRV